jgi:tripartite ATP-independent transporter DctP family solute receptor
MPYFITSQEKFRGVVDGPLSKPMYDAMLERKGLRHIAWENRGPRYLTSNKPVSIPADLKGIKIRVPEVEMSMAAWKMLGAIVTPMAFPEVFMALKQGTIDAQENPYELIYGSSFFEVQKYLNQTAHLRSGYEVVVSEKWFKTLSPELQKTVSDGLVEMAKLQDKMQAEDEAGYETKMKDKGMIFNPVQLDKFQEALVDLPKQFQSKWMPGFFEDVQKFVK